MSDLVGNPEDRFSHNEDQIRIWYNILFLMLAQIQKTYYVTYLWNFNEEFDVSPGYKHVDSETISRTYYTEPMCVT